MTPRILPRALIVAGVCSFVGGCAQLPQTTATDAIVTRDYTVTYTVSIEAGSSDYARASIEVEQDSRILRELRFRVDESRHSGFSADGDLAEGDGYVTWQLPRKGGTLNYDVQISQQRRSGSYDARMTDDWALFRIGDVFPPAATRTVVDANSIATLELELPADWSALTPYLSGDSKYTFPVNNPERRFDRPTGWVLLGDIGVRRGLIADTRVAIGSPVGEGVHRMDIMAYLNWTLPALRRIFPTLDRRLVIVSAGNPMWRGGLSGPGSLYVHADRPMISENGTSTMLHELIHVAMGVSGSEHDDWIVEGLAEYYSIKILRVTETLSNRRKELALEDLREWGDPVDNLFVRRASGPVTARATTLLAELDDWIGATTRGRRSLDDVVGEMISNNAPYSYKALCAASFEVAGATAPVLKPDNVPGAKPVAACTS